MIDGSLVINKELVRRPDVNWVAFGWFIFCYLTVNLGFTTVYHNKIGETNLHLHQSRAEQLWKQLSVEDAQFFSRYLLERKAWFRSLHNYLARDMCQDHRFKLIFV